MAFRLTQWLITFAIFLVVLTIISWSAVHLGKKNKNTTDIVLRFLDMNDYPIERKNLTQVTENTDGTMLYANNQGFEVKDSAEFYKMLKAIRSTKNNFVNSTKDDTTTAIFTSSIISNDSTWSEDTTIYDSSDVSFALNNYQNVSREIINISNHTPLITQPMITHGARLLDMNGLWNIDPYQSAEKEFSDSDFEDKENRISNVSISFIQVSSEVTQCNTTQPTRIMQSTHAK